MSLKKKLIAEGVQEAQMSLKKKLIAEGVVAQTVPKLKIRKNSRELKNIGILTNMDKFEEELRKEIEGVLRIHVADRGDVSFSLDVNSVDEIVRQKAKKYKVELGDDVERLVEDNEIDLYWSTKLRVRKKKIARRRAQ